MRRSVDIEFAEFVSARLAALHRYAFVLTGSPHDAEDLVQEALVRTGAAWRRVINKDDPEGYVRRTMVHLACNRWRRSKREWLGGAQPDQSAPDVGLAEAESAHSLVALLGRLPPRQQVVLVLRYEQDLSEQQIAGLMGCSTGTVKSQASKALAALRRQIGEDRVKEAVDGQP
jgi:RNA polymerase sigma-70 factor (sigma-E family)